MPQLPFSERQGIPHHLIDIADPAEDFSAGKFFHMARQTTQEILQVQSAMRPVTIKAASACWDQMCTHRSASDVTCNIS